MAECPTCGDKFDSFDGVSKHHTAIHPNEFEELFWSLAGRSGDNGCWEWQGAYSGDGYGLINRDGKRYKVHRLAYLFEYGHIEKPQVNHHCDNKMCVNPDHLYNGTQSDNMQDAYQRNENVRSGLDTSLETNMKRLQKIQENDLYARGEDASQSKLTEAEVRNIKEMVGVHTDTEIAEQYGVDRRTIRQIRIGNNWAHI